MHPDGIGLLLIWTTARWFLRPDSSHAATPKGTSAASASTAAKRKTLQDKGAAAAGRSVRRRAAPRCLIMIGTRSERSAVAHTAHPEV